MNRARVIPCLLLQGYGLVKTCKFKERVYIGDPINAVRIFNDKEVDELVVLDIDASKDGREPNYKLIEEISGECFMPLAYGGGITSVDQAKCLIRSGVEKLILNTAAIQTPELISDISKIFGKQAVVASIDVRKNLYGRYRTVTNSGLVETKFTLKEHISTVVDAGAGELLINSLDRDGTMKGFDIPMIKMVTSQVSVPVIACGGAGSVGDLASAIGEGGASAVAAGSMFVFHGKHRAVLISYPTEEELQALEQAALLQSPK